MRAPILYRPETVSASNNHQLQNASTNSQQQQQQEQQPQQQQQQQPPAPNSNQQQQQQTSPAAITTTIQKPAANQAQQPPHNQNQGQQAASAVPLAQLGGQRMALKMASKPATKSNPSATSWTSRNFNNNRMGPPQAHQSNRQSPCDTIDCDDLSDCSCSNSLECLSQQPQSPPMHQPQQLVQRPHQALVVHQMHSYPFQSSPYPPMGAQQQQHQPLPVLQQHEAYHQRQMHHQHQANFHHRPLLANTSMTRIISSHPQNVCAQLPPPAPPPPPPPLVRQSTYSATPETITDASLQANGTNQAHQDYQQHRPVAWQQQKSRSVASDKQYQAATLSRLDVGAYNSSGIQKQRQTVSFRKTNLIGANGSIENHNGNEHSASTSDLIIKNLFSDSGQEDPNDESGKSDFMMLKGGGHQRAQGKRQRAKQSNFRQTSLHDCSATSSPIMNQQTPHQHHHQQQMQPGPNYQAASPLIHQHHQQQPTSLTATQTPLGSLGLDDGACNRTHNLMASNHSNFDAANFSMPAITSHRTNSPWMRISSIILTPIGIVIILFIVVSPLLHYLM